jgi:hypothetical protein
VSKLINSYFCARSIPGLRGREREREGEEMGGTGTGTGKKRGRVGWWGE